MVTVNHTNVKELYGDNPLKIFIGYNEIEHVESFNLEEGWVDFAVKDSNNNIFVYCNGCVRQQHYGKEGYFLLKKDGSWVPYKENIHEEIVVSRIYSDLISVEVVD